jgi:hypothetical protein
MPIDSSPIISKKVEQLFAATEGDETACRELGYLTEKSRWSDEALKELAGSERFPLFLQTMRSKLGDEEYDQLANQVANDPRVEKYLPVLALDVMSGGWTSEMRKPDPREFDYRRLSDLRIEDTKILNGSLDQNCDRVLDSQEITKGANDAQSFDPVQRRALQFVADHYQSYCNLDKLDRYKSFMGIETNGRANDYSITRRDLGAGANMLGMIRATPGQMAALTAIKNGFNEMDKNGSGIVTFTEARPWLHSRSSEQVGYEWLQAYLPKKTYRELAGSEQLTRADIDKKIVDTATSYQDNRAAWFGKRSLSWPTPW